MSAAAVTMSFRQLAEEVLVQRERDGVRGFDREMSRYRCHIATAAFAERPVASIGSPDIRTWLREMKQKPAAGYGPKRTLSRQTISRCQSLVSAVFHEAVERELREDNPSLAAKQKKSVDESDTEEKWAYLTPAEQTLIFACEEIPLADKLMIGFAIHTGLRQGEQRHLELGDIIVDGENPRVVVRIASRRKDKGDGTFKKLPPKSGKRREVPLFGEGLRIAKEWLAILPTYAPENPSNLVFPSPRGKHRHQGKFLGKSGTLRQLYKAAGITLRPHLHWHALRHTYATNLISGALGRPWRLEEIQVVMGHSSVTITQRYAHLGADAIRQAARETELASVAEVPRVVEVPIEAMPELAPATPAPVGFFGRIFGAVKRIAEGAVS